MFDADFYLGKLFDDLVDRQVDGEFTEEEMESKMEDLRLLTKEQLKQKYEALVRRRKDGR